MKTYEQTDSMMDVVMMTQVLRQVEDAAIGELTGPTRIGKTAAGKHIAEQPRTLRICCYQGISPFKLQKTLRQTLAQIGHEGWPEDYPASVPGEGRPLLVVDECNKANWATLEALRYLADECGYAVLLIGTELYSRQFADARTAPLLQQLNDRIGGKRVVMKPMDRNETIVHVLRPRFGDVDLKVGTAFWQASRKGYWGPAIELAETCRRVLDANGLSVLDGQVLNVALAAMGRAPMVEPAEG